MERIRNWLLPVLLAAAQLALWPGAPLLDGQPVERVELAAGVAATVLAAVALGWRRRSPLAALAGVVLALTPGLLATSPDALAVLATSDVVALYSVAARRGNRVTLAAVAALIGWQAVLGLAIYASSAREYFGTLLLVVAAYLLTAGLGHSRRRWRAARGEAAARIARAEEEQQRAAATERDRLARELHDVSAHHLTSIVVTAAAAERLADRRPELVTEALEFAARTGRETLAALHRLIAVMRTAEQDGPPRADARMEELAAGFARLGQPVTFDLSPALASSTVADAAHGIAREALTNALRYAPGAAVRVQVAHRDGVFELVVDDDGDGAAPSAAPLGSGRGLAGMRERAAAAGGTVTAGPRPGGGWRVRAVLPSAAEAPPAPAARPWWRRLREQRLIDGATALAAIAFPVAIAIVAEEADGFAVPDPGGGALITLLMVAHGGPLLWRRHAPWAVLAVVVATTAFWPLAIWYELLPEAALANLAMGAIAECAAVYAVAAYGRYRWLAVLAVPAAAAGLSAALVLAAAVDGSVLGEPATVPTGVLVWVFAAAGAGIVLAGTWVVGFASRVRRERVLAREDSALSAAAGEALAAAQAERLRIAAGLRAAVLHRAGLVVTVAEEGRLDGVTAEARAALAAMRELLNSLRDGDRSARRGPQSTVASLDALCDQIRAGGREVVLDSPAQPPPLPADVDVSVFRVVEAALEAGDTGPARVSLRYRPDELVVTVTGVPSAATGPTLAGLRARMAVVSGQIAADVTGTVRVWLPVDAPPAPVEEVAPSPSA